MVYSRVGCVFDPGLHNLQPLETELFHFFVSPFEEDAMSSLSVFSGGSRGGGPPPLFLDQTEVRRAENNKTSHPTPFI